jgi:hypothetical protein
MQERLNGQNVLAKGCIDGGLVDVDFSDCALYPSSHLPDFKANSVKARTNLAKYKMTIAYTSEKPWHHGDGRYNVSVSGKMSDIFISMPHRFCRISMKAC